METSHSLSLQKKQKKISQKKQNQPKIKLGYLRPIMLGILLGPHLENSSGMLSIMNLPKVKKHGRCHSIQLKPNLYGASIQPNRSLILWMYSQNSLLITHTPSQ